MPPAPGLPLRLSDPGGTTDPPRSRGRGVDFKGNTPLHYATSDPSCGAVALQFLDALKEHADAATAAPGPPTKEPPPSGCPQQGRRSSTLRIA